MVSGFKLVILRWLWLIWETHGRSFAELALSAPKALLSKLRVQEGRSFETDLLRLEALPLSDDHKPDLSNPQIPGDSWRFLESWAVGTAVDNLHERANSKDFKGFSWPEANRTSSNRECQQLRTSLQKVCRINLDSVLDSVSRKQADIHSIEWHKDVFYM